VWNTLKLKTLTGFCACVRLITNGIAWTVGGVSQTQVWGLDDFKTPATSYFAK
jgi:hypothetical protein